MTDAPKTTDYRALWKARTAAPSEVLVAQVDKCIREAIDKGLPSTLIRGSPAEVEAITKWALAQGLGAEGSRRDRVVRAADTGLPVDLDTAFVRLSWD